MMYYDNCGLIEKLKISTIENCDQLLLGISKEVKELIMILFFYVMEII